MAMNYDEAAGLMRRSFARLGAHEKSLREDLLNELVSAARSVGGNGANPLAYAEDRVLKKYLEGEVYEILGELYAIAHDFFLLQERPDVLRGHKIYPRPKRPVFQPPSTNPEEVGEYVWSLFNGMINSREFREYLRAQKKTPS